MFIFLKYFLLEGRGCESCTGRQEGGEDFIVEDFTVEGYVPSSLLQRQTGHAKLALLCCLWGRSYNVLYTSWGFNCSFGFVVNNDSGSGGAIEIPCLTNDQLLAHLGDVQETDKLPPHPSVKSMVQAQSTAGLWRRF